MDGDDARLPFRWDLVAPDRLGSLLDGIEPPTLPWRDELVRCAAKVVARAGGGRLVFVGRSLDSMFDLLSGALAGLGQPDVVRFPVSFARPVAYEDGRWVTREQIDRERRRARTILTSLGARTR